jgi:hypothetical protein
MTAADGFAEEQVLVRAVQTGDEAAFGTLVDRYVDSAYATACRAPSSGRSSESAS